MLLARYTIIAIFLVCGIYSVTAHAQGFPFRPDYEEIFKNIDTNQDNKIDLKELFEFKPPFGYGPSMEERQKKFLEFDENNDSFLTYEEFVNFRTG